MRQLVLGNGRVRLEECPEPEPEPGWVVVRPVVLPICGSDRAAYEFEGDARWAGHEGTGVVTAAWAGSRFRPGDRVVIAPQAGCGECTYCRSGDYIFCADAPEHTGHFRELVKKQEFILPRLPEDIPFDVGSLAGCALTPGFGVLERTGTGAHDTVLVVGAGPVGLRTVAAAAFRGARVLAVEPNPFRRRLACLAGAQDAFDPAGGQALEWVRELTGGRGATVCVECTGRGECLRLCIEAAARLGRVGVVGENHGPVGVAPSEDLIRKGLTLVGAWVMNARWYDRLFDLLRRKPDIGGIITHRFALGDAQQAFDAFFRGRQTGKVLLTLSE